MSMLAWVAWTIGLAVAKVLIAMLSTLIDRAGSFRLHRWAQEGGGVLERLHSGVRRFEAYRVLLAVVSHGLTVALYCILFVGFAHVLPVALEPWSALIAAGLVTAVVLLYCALVGRRLLHSDPEVWLTRLRWAYVACLLPLMPLVLLLRPFMPREPSQRHGVGTEDEEDEATEEEIEAYLDVGLREGILEEAESEWVRRVVDFPDTVARTVMTPRVDVRAAPSAVSLDDLAELFVDSGHARLPLYGESLDDVVGIVHIREVLRALRAPNAGDPVTELAMPALFVPETKPLGELFSELQAQHQQMAIVVDEYGGMAGLLTVEDLLEEIVGELIDEHELDEPAPEALDDGAWMVDGRTLLDDLKDLFGVEIETSRYETVGGLILTLVGDVPDVGRSVETEGLKFTVTAVDGRRIESVRVEAGPKAGEPVGEESPA